MSAGVSPSSAVKAAVSRAELSVGLPRSVTIGVVAVVLALFGWLMVRSPSGSGDSLARADASAASEAGGGTPVAGLDQQAWPGLAPDLGIEGRLVAAGRGRVTVIELATGSSESFEVSGEPVGVVGPELVLFRPAIGFVALNLDRPEDPVRVIVDLKDMADDEPVAPLERPVTAVIQAGDTILAEYTVSPLGSIRATSIVYRVEVATGVYTRHEVEVGRASWWFGHGRLGLAWVPGAGLFDGLGPDPVKLSTGIPLLYGADFVITYQCEEPSRCELGWIDRATGQAVDHDLPTVEELWWEAVEVGDGGQVLLVEGSNDRQYFDVTRGRWLGDEVNQLQESVVESHRFGRRPEAVTADGRWLAVPVGPTLSLYDLEGETLYQFTIPGLASGQRLFFADEPGPPRADG